MIDYDVLEYVELTESDEFVSRVKLFFITNQIMEVFCIIVNILHLMVLLKKPLRSNSVFMLMIGVSVFEMLYFIQNFSNELIEINFLSYDTFDEICLKVELSIIHPLWEAWQMVSNMSRRMFVWLMVQLALIRALSITFPMVNWLIKPKITVLVSLLIFVFWWFLYYWPLLSMRRYWKPDVLESQICLNWTKIETKWDIYIFAIPLEYSLTFKVFMRESEGSIRLLTVAVYCLLVLVLLLKLAMVNRKRKKLNSKSSSENNTTMLVFLMTVTFFIAESSGAAMAFYTEYGVLTGPITPLGYL
ncbi:unnamed protein product [Caenorhabditis brenneri]